MHNTRCVLAFFIFAGLCAAVVGTQKTGTLGGIISGPDGNPLPGVSVTVVSPASQRETVKTEQNGTFLISNLPSGSYNIEIHAAGYRSVPERNLDVVAGTRTGLNVTMESSKAKD